MGYYVSVIKTFCTKFLEIKQGLQFKIIPNIITSDTFITKLYDKKIKKRQITEIEISFFFGFNIFYTFEATNGYLHLLQWFPTGVQRNIIFI